jgi:hypothetical protein
VKKILLILISSILLVVVSACSGTTSPQEQERESVIYDPNEMPEPFPTQGGNPHLAPFFLPTDNEDGNNSLNSIPFYVIDPFISKDSFYAWIEREGNEYLRTPQISLLDYPNFYSFILEFNIPADRLKETLKEQQRLGMQLDIQFYTDEEIDIICSLDETRIAEYFASDYSIIIGGKIYPPTWLYLHTPEEWQRVGITPEMVEERLELFSEFNFTLEATEAFGKKLAEFIGAESSDVIEALNS